MINYSRLSAVSLAFALFLSEAAPAQAAQGDPWIPEDFVAGFLASAGDPERMPPGAMSPDQAKADSCKGAKFATPVVLIPGTWENAYDNWAYLSNELRGQGHCVFALNYGGKKGEVMKAYGHIPTSAAEVGAQVERIAKATGSKVDLVGHSQGGGPTPRWYLSKLGGNKHVRRMVGINPSNHGTKAMADGSWQNLVRQMAGLLAPAARGEAAEDQMIGSKVNEELDATGDTAPGVDYYTINSTADLVVVPYRNGELKAPADGGSRVVNVTLQDYCPKDLSRHVGSPYSPNVAALVKQFLQAPTSGQKPARFTCQPVSFMLQSLV